MSRQQHTLLKHSWIILWLFITLVFLITVPGYHGQALSDFIPMSAQMLHQGSYLIPHWYGSDTLYTNKPPLMNWLYIIGWKIFGISAWWPQFVALAFSGGAVYFTQGLAYRLWPEQSSIGKLTPFVLISLFAWVMFAKKLHVDFLLAFAVTMSLFAFVGTLQKKRGSWLLYGIAISIGTFAKGPVIFLFSALIPGIIILLQQQHTLNRKKYLLSCLGINILALLPIACWLLLVYWQQGPAIIQTMLLKPIHEGTIRPRSWYFYLIRLPFYLLPWLLYWPLLSKLSTCKPSRANLGLLLSAVTVITALLFFSAYPQKSLVYLWPALPAVGLLASYAIAQYRFTPSRATHLSQCVLAILLVLLGFTVALLPIWIAPTSRLLILMQQTPIVYPLIVGAAGLLGCCYRSKTQLQQVIFLACLFAILNGFLAGVLSYYKPGFQKTVTRTFTTLRQPSRHSLP